ncbi:glycosyltransferase family 2 protein [Paenibacillus sp. GCM10027627]|uniref:glycosyltransferase family 2 protein n=1 Tax=unclassified Paenibacillus TaxID=185978 RepID=UPI00363ED0AA
MSEVCIIVPVYNAGQKLHRCIRSILSQSFVFWTLLLIDDGSSDDSSRICQDYERLDIRIRHYSQSHSGSVAARRRGLELSASPYIMFVDADDWIDAAMLDKLVSAARRDNADIAVCNTYKVLSETAWPKRMNRSSYFQTEKLYGEQEVRSELVPAFLHGHPFPPQLHGKLYKRDLLAASGNYASRIAFFGDDLFFNLETFLHAKSVKVIPDALYYYRAGGLTSRYMPDLFQDIVSGYGIQKEVVEAFYPDRLHDYYTGIRLMLLNTLLACLQNLFQGSLSGQERLSAISGYCAHPVVKECVSDDSAARRCPPDYIRAIRFQDSTYLYKLGRGHYRTGLPKKWMMNAISKMTF